VRVFSTISLEILRIGRNVIENAENTKGKIMDKIYIIRSDEYIFRVYSSKWEAEKYFRHIEDSINAGNKFIPKYKQNSRLDLQLIAIPISQEGDPLDMRLMNIHAGAGDSTQYHELGEVK
jgi:hypothetical protein